MRPIVGSAPGRVLQTAEIGWGAKLQSLAHDSPTSCPPAILQRTSSAQGFHVVLNFDTLNTVRNWDDSQPLHAYCSLIVTTDVAREVVFKMQDISVQEIATGFRLTHLFFHTLIDSLCLLAAAGGKEKMGHRAALFEESYPFSGHQAACGRCCKFQGESSRGLGGLLCKGNCSLTKQLLSSLLPAPTVPGGD